MSAVASVSPVTSRFQTIPAYRVSNQNSPVNIAQAASASVKVNQSLATVQSSASITQQGLPEGLLLSVSQPSSSNSEATSDYRDLRIALQSGNLTAAQQAYTRLQIDLELTYAAQSSSVATSATSAANMNGTGLNVVA
jgi:hypothetical protein